MTCHHVDLIKLRRGFEDPGCSMGGAGDVPPGRVVISGDAFICRGGLADRRFGNPLSGWIPGHFNWTTQRSYVSWDGDAGIVRWCRQLGGASQESLVWSSRVGRTRDRINYT